MRQKRKTMERRKEILANKENIVAEDGGEEQPELSREEQPAKRAKVGHKGLIKPVFRAPKVVKTKTEPFKESDNIYFFVSFLCSG